MSNVEAVILAGGPGFSADCCRAMTPVAGKTMLQWEVDAIRQSGAISRICAVGDCAADGIDEILPPTDSFLGNLLAGVSRARENGSQFALVATSDIPLVTPEGIADFVARASATGADFCYPVIPKSECVRKYPEMRRTYLKLKEGVFTGGNMVFVSVGFITANSEIIGRAYDARKRVFQLAGMIGWLTLLRVLIAQTVLPSAVNLETLEKTVSRLLNGSVRAVITSYAEIGEDVDKLEDLAIVEKLMAPDRSGREVSP
ncbi:MAG: NTP transferase domain-containing protein [Armatimonadota bacterium]|nr:NTP transferase domain-containing protein [Armatimonadota bacterium]